MNIYLEARPTLLEATNWLFTSEKLSSETVLLLENQIREKIPRESWKLKIIY